MMNHMAGATVRRPMLDLADAEKATVRAAFERSGLRVSDPSKAA
jgi:hypothetical protein